MRILVNAIPLLGANTGVARYIRSLYTNIEHQFAGQCHIAYFDGKSVLDTLPNGPKQMESWSRLVDLFWKLPPQIAFLIRMAMQERRQRAFDKIAEDYDIYHETGFFPFHTPKGLKTAFTIHDVSILRHPEYHPRERVMFTTRRLRQRVRNVDAVLTVSEYSKSEIIKSLNIPESQVTATPLGFRPEIFRPSNGNDARPPLPGIPERYVLSLGSGDPRKNLELIPKGLAASELGIPLVSVGWYGGKEKASKQTISLGFVPDEMLVQLYQNALALIYPSFYEGFGLPVIEAMACGCPVITTRLTSLPEVAGDAALYLDSPDSVEDLSQHLRKLANDDQFRQQMVHASLQRAARYSWAETANQTVAVFERMLTGGARH